MTRTLFFVLMAISLIGCQTLDPEKIRQEQAQFAIKPLHRAAAYHKVAGFDYMIWGQPDAQTAADKAVSQCQQISTQRSVDPGQCQIIWVDDQILYDPVGAAVQQQQDMQLFLQGLQMGTGLIPH